MMTSAQPSAAFPFCQTSQAVHREVDMAIRDGWTVGKFVEWHIGPKSHDFLPDFTNKYIVGEGRVFHDPCHPILALGYKAMGVDTSQFAHWYNGNQHAESLVVPIEMFFNDMLRPQKKFSLDFYQDRTKLMMQHLAMKDRHGTRQAIAIANASDEPVTVFDIFRRNHFDNQCLSKEVKSLPSDQRDVAYDVFETKWGEKIHYVGIWPEEFLERVYKAITPILDCCRQEIEPQMEFETGIGKRQAIANGLNSMRMDKMWQAAIEQRPAPKLRVIPSP